MRFASEAWPFVLPFAALAAGAVLIGHPGWGAAAAAVALAVLLFFRDPRRVFGGGEAAIVAPAAGRITRVDRVAEPAVAEEPVHRVVTFLSVFDVHVQRSPVAGEVVTSVYTPGRKVAAFRADAGDVNENHLLVIRRDDGEKVGVRQIAGLLARRVVAYPQIGDRLERGQLIGLIKFGSRVDLLLPPGDAVEVERGQRVVDGTTQVATRGRRIEVPGGPAA